MTKKLTLSMSERVIESAKRYAEKKGVSLSSLVEEYFSRITSRRTSAVKRNLIRAKGMLGDVPADFDYKKEIRDYVYEKHVKR